MKPIGITAFCITTLLFIGLLHKTLAHPFQFQENVEEEEEDSHEEHQTKVQVNHSGQGRNATADQEIADKATAFLAQYFAGGGTTGAPSSNEDEDGSNSPAKQNRTIIITIVDEHKNKTEDTEELGVTHSSGEELITESGVLAEEVPSTQPSLVPLAVEGLPLDTQQQQQLVTIGADGQLIPLDPTVIQAAGVGGASAQQQQPIIFIGSPYVPPPPPSTTPRTAPSLFGAVSRIIGSIAEGNLGGAVENSFKLVEVPEIQDTAKFAAGGVIHSLGNGLSSGIQNGISATSGITNGIRSQVSGITSGLTGNNAPAVETAAISGGVSPGIVAIDNTGVIRNKGVGPNCQVFGNCAPAKTIFRNVPATTS